ncbi:vitellogenin [Pogona vitticeps]
MEFQHMIMLLSIVVTGVSRYYGALSLSTGSRLSYRYSTSTNTFLQGRADKRSGISLEATVVVEVLAKCHRVLQLQDVQIKIILESKEKLHKENVNLRKVLEQHPLLFCFHNGKILKIFPQEREPIWALNIKRGILSVFQTSLAAAVTNRTVQEVDILGKCPTKYHRKGSLLWKTKDLDLCSHRFSLFTSLRSVALPNAPSQEQLLSSKLECVQRFKEQILEEAKCTESHLVRPPTKKSGGVKTQIQTSMKLFRTDAGVTVHERDTKDIYESTLLYEKEKAAQLSGEEEEEVVADILQKLCVKPRVDLESAELFMTLVFELRHLSSDALMSLWQRSSSKCQDDWQPLSDALPSCTTEACVVLMKELIVSGKVGEEKMESFFQLLSFIPEPTAGMIDALAPLLQLSRETQSAFLGITALVNHFCSMRNNCDQEPAVRGVMKNLEQHLGEKCTLHKSEGIGQVELILKAIGNAGLAAAPLEPVLNSCARWKNNPIEIRLAAIEAYRRIPCTVNHDVLMHLYLTYDEDVEIRIASYLMLMKCPNKELFNQVKFTLQEERSSQVGSFVWSHLSELLETDDPLKQHLKSFLPDDILSKEFDREMWKFSSYSDVTFHSGTGSANVEARIIFSPMSFLPRLIVTNFTIYVLGRAVNILEASCLPCISS